ncbi:hypothetical protein B0H13DRAFT_2016155 [Mycena leptocephala]|nr:hypothetical protein B0H13DRAFT_2016155 [Mycena leptocephala]
MSFSDAGVPAMFSREAGHPTRHKTLIDIFLTLQMLGLIGSCALVLTTTLSSRAPRNATWQNFFTSWIISTVSYSLLLFAGQGIPSLTAATTFGLIAQIWFSVKNERIWTIALLILPYVFLLALVIASWTIGIRNTDQVKIIGSGMYCHLVSGAMVALTLLPTIALKVFSICIALRRNWGTFKRMKHSLSIILRVVVFTMFGILAIAVSGVFVFTNNHGASLNIVFGILPITAVVVFSTQKDIISVWMFWKPQSEEKMVSSPISSSSSV